MLVSAVEQSESSICIHISPLSWASLPSTPHPTPLGHHRALSWAPCAIQQLLLWLLYSVYFFLVLTNEPWYLIPENQDKQVLWPKDLTERQQTNGCVETCLFLIYSQPSISYRHIYVIHNARNAHNLYFSVVQCFLLGFYYRRVWKDTYSSFIIRTNKCISLERKISDDLLL